MISRFLKGIFKNWPPKPKYIWTFDVSTGLQFLGKLYPLAHRAQTLASIRMWNIQRSASGLKVQIPDVIETTGLNRFQPLLLIPVFTDEPKLWVASTIFEYLEVTKKLRGSTNKLFIATKKPFKEITTQTISKWIKSILQKKWNKCFNILCAFEKALCNFNSVDERR